MEWIKASERVPANRNLVHLNYSTGATTFKTTGYYEEGTFKGQHGGNPISFQDNLLWLDESESPQPSKPEQVGKEAMSVKERDDMDLLELVCQLHSRALNYPSEALHNYYMEARVELEKRLAGWKAIAESNRGANKEACEAVWALTEENKKLSEQGKPVGKEAIELEQAAKDFYSRTYNEAPSKTAFFIAGAKWAEQAKQEAPGLPHINEVKQKYAELLGYKYASELETSDSVAVEEVYKIMKR